MSAERPVSSDTPDSGLAIHRVVFGTSVALIVAFVVFTLANLGAAETWFSAVRAWIAQVFGWLLILSVQSILLFCVYIAMSRFGHIRIGGPDATPDYSWLSWFAMLFAAVATLFGVATSLGLGVLQINAGLNYLFDLSISTGVQMILIAVITAFLVNLPELRAQFQIVGEVSCRSLFREHVALTSGKRPRMFSGRAVPGWRKSEGWRIGGEQRGHFRKTPESV